MDSPFLFCMIYPVGSHNKGRAQKEVRPKLKRLLAVLLTLTLAVAVAGCTPAKKPLPPAPKTAPKTAPKAKAPIPGASRMPTSSSELHKLAAKLAGEAAKVPGVKKATVVLSSTMAYVGLDLKAGIEAGKTNTIKKDVADRVKKADKRLTSVYVSTNPDLVTRIKKVAEGVKKGKPISSFDREISEIGRRIVPKPGK